MLTCDGTRTVGRLRKYADGRGFRLDTVKHVSHAFWRRHRRESQARVSPAFFLLGEVWGGSAQTLDEYFVADEMDAGFDFTFRGECRAFVESRGRTVAYAAYLEKRQRVREGYRLAHYLSSHDEPMLLHELNGDKEAFRLCVAMHMTSFGIPTIYYGEEVARRGSVWPINRTDMPWNGKTIEPGAGQSRDEAMREWYRQLIAIRHAHPALRDGSFRRLSADGDLIASPTQQQKELSAALLTGVTWGSTANQAPGQAKPVTSLGRAAPAPVKETKPANKPVGDAVAGRLRRIESLHNEKLISDEEYARLRRKILSEL